MNFYTTLPQLATIVKNDFLHQSSVPVKFTLNDNLLIFHRSGFVYKICESSNSDSLVYVCL